MKNIKNNNCGILLGLALLSTSTLIGFATPASAQPRRNGDVKAARKDVKEARKDLKREKRDLRQERQENRRPGYQGQNRPPSAGGNRNVGRAYTGTVTRVRSTQSFDINIGGNIFNVYTVSRTPWGLSTGDTVRVNGVQQYNNDIRNASVSIIRNR